MGLFNRVLYQTRCPTCNEALSNFQTKDNNPDLRWVLPADVGTFYTLCYCGTELIYKKSRSGNLRRIISNHGDKTRVRSGHAKASKP